MNIYHVDDLRANVILDRSLYSRVDGIKFLQAGTQITAQSLSVLRRRQEEEVYGLNVEEEIAVDLGEGETPVLEPRTLRVSALKSGDRVGRGLYDVDGTRLLLTEARILNSEDVNALGSLSSVQPESILVWYRSRLF